MRDHKAELARLSSQIDLLWAWALPPWVREAMPTAEQNGWRVEPTAEALIFHQLDRDDTWTIPIPLPVDGEAVRRCQQELHMRIGYIGYAAARRVA